MLGKLLGMILLVRSKDYMVTSPGSNRTPSYIRRYSNFTKH